MEEPEPIRVSEIMLLPLLAPPWQEELPHYPTDFDQTSQNDPTTNSVDASPLQAMPQVQLVSIFATVIAYMCGRVHIERRLWAYVVNNS